jgi:signal transduction histidine kinase
VSSSPDNVHDLLMTVREVLRLVVADERDVFAARQRGREVAAAVGLENQDQVRVATALSELGRELVLQGRRAEVALSLTADPVPALVVRARWVGSASEVEGTEGVLAASRLTDGCEIAQDGEYGSVALRKRLPVAAEVPTAAAVEGLRTRFAGAGATGSVLDELRVQNQELLRTLENLQARQDDLEHANAELEDTNRGVLALHAELSDELEKTNQGVVALYAELDEKSTQLREANEAKTRFWANVSHELRTPINSVIGLARLLLDPAVEALSDEQHHQVDMIRDAGSVLLALVNELLDVAKAESGRLEPLPRLVDVGALLQYLRASLAPLVPPEVQLLVDVPADLAPMITDPEMLSTIVRNLVTNALKFTERGEVRIEVRAPTADRLQIAVVDTGIGIPADQLPRVLEEFHQVPGPLQVGKHGSGLGLPLARRLADILGGSLTLSSEVGAGTTALLELPATVLAAPDALGRVLVVDDDPAFRALVRRAFTAAAAEIAEVGDGAGALELLHAEPPVDVVVLDLNIPPPDGWQVLAEIRADPRLADLPVVIVTAGDPDPTRAAELADDTVVLRKVELTPALLVAAAAEAHARGRTGD